MTDILWLASFPKSGNTWVKMILAAIRAKGELSDINDPTISASCTSKELADQFSTIRVSEEDYFAFQRSEIFKKMVLASGEHELILKTHCCHISIGGESLIPNSLSRGCILIVRNPFDVVCSVMNHFSLDEFAAIELLTSNKSRIGHPDLHYSNWIISWHVFHNSWLKNFSKPILVLRYEDMIAEPLQQYRRIADFMSQSLSDLQLRRVISSTSFNRLKYLEEKSGFQEKPAEAKRFFNQGKVGSFKTQLSQKGINEILKCLENHMNKIGYFFNEGDLEILPTTLTHR